ncbi:MAG TPA: type II toxin-antitoxin system VapC family toxin [Rhodopila sp.]|uniref:type II toxin-antitoxin system VapC family toxin n=1 Tax=Rhodopila sp. TaxID=2480087 RepID=UPI002BFAE03F|nr:type II toxin-antitoxin system VapC family toxin [Rhodopila sp.]HVY14588.1 type II toxin-antitoxin system VapC family toxin [Rhodopila sp.]
MKVTADTNVLLRACVADDAEQARAAVACLASAEQVVVSLQALWEFAWVLRRQYKTGRSDVAAAIRALLDTENVLVNCPGAEAGLAVLEAGGDFADGIIAFEGNWQGADTFVSFDKNAVTLLASQGIRTQLLT